MNRTFELKPITLKFGKGTNFLIRGPFFNLIDMEYSYPVSCSLELGQCSSYGYTCCFPRFSRFDKCDRKRMEAKAECATQTPEPTIFALETKDKLPLYLKEKLSFTRFTTMRRSWLETKYHVSLDRLEKTNQGIDITAANNHCTFAFWGNLSNGDGDAEDNAWLKMNLSFIHEFCNFLRVFGV